MIPLNNAKERLQGTMEMENDRGITAILLCFAKQKKKSALRLLEGAFQLSGIRKEGGVSNTTYYQPIMCPPRPQP